MNNHISLTDISGWPVIIPLWQLKTPENGELDPVIPKYLSSCAGRLL